LQNALQDRQTAAILRKYALAFKPFNAPNEPAAVEVAENAATGPTAAHAVQRPTTSTQIRKQQ
jgi:hypothetical protein